MSGGLLAPEPQEAVLLEAVSKQYVISGTNAITALQDVSATIPAAEIVAVAGSSGSGKSTLLHVIGALERPDQGRVVVAGNDLRQLNSRELSRHRRSVGFVFQRFNLLPALTVIDNVLAPVLPYRTPFDKSARATELLTSVGLAGRERSMPSELSGGQQQRVAIARALVSAPPLILADEPTGNLDSGNGREIIDLLLNLRAERAVTIMIATHDPAVACRCDRVIRLLDGRVVDDVTVDGMEQITALLGAAG